MLEETIFIHKLHPYKEPQMDEFFIINSPRNLQQSYAGIYQISSIIEVISGYKPSRIIINCAHFHAKDIVKFIFSILVLKKYRLLISRVSYTNDSSGVKIIVLNFKIMV